MLHAVTTAFGLAAAAAVIWDLVGRGGRGPAGWLRHRPAGPLEEWGAAGLLGLAVLGSSLLGLALTGLCYRGLVIAALPVLAAAGSRRAMLRSPLVAALGRIRAIPPAGIGLAVLALVPVIPWLLSPRVDQDSLAYHLGLPWACLSTHRALLSAVPWTWHLGLPIDLAYALPLALGEDRLARWILAGAAAAATAVAAGRALSKGDSSSGWLGVLLALSSPVILGLSTLTKNDLGAAAFLVAGGVLWAETGSATAAVLLGGSIAAKLTNAPLALLWLLLARPRRSGIRGLAVPLGLAAVPVLPWLLKSWLATGNPVYPLWWRLFAGAGWTAANDAAIRAMGVWSPDTFRPRELLRLWLTSWWSDYRLPACGLILLAFTGKARPAGILAAGSLLTLGLGHMTRFTAPAAWLAAVLAPAALNRLAGRAGRAASTLAGCLALVAVWRSPVVKSAPWSDATRPAAEVRAADLTTYDAAQRRLSASAPGRVLSIGEERTYRMPGRVLYNGFLGETPVVWKLCRESRSLPELRRRVRQLGARLAWYNFVSVERGSFFAASFGWDSRMLRLWYGFCRGGLAVRDVPREVDARGGGIYVFGLRDRPVSPPPKTVWFLPGAETAIRDARILRDARRDREAIRAFDAVLSIVPGTLYFMDQLGLVYYAMEDWAGVARAMEPSVSAGMIDGANLPSLGAALTYLGRLDEAVSVITRAIAVYDTDSPNRVNLAWALRQRAERSMRAGRLDAASADLDGASNALAEVPADSKAFWAGPRAEVAALVEESRRALARRRTR